MIASKLDDALAELERADAAMGRALTALETDQGRGALEALEQAALAVRQAVRAVQQAGEGETIEETIGETAEEATRQEAVKREKGSESKGSRRG